MRGGNVSVNKNLDLALLKDFRVPGAGGLQGARLQLRLEALYIGNWVNLNNPEGRITNATFGRVTSTRTSGQVGGPRVLQLGVKYIF